MTCIASLQTKLYLAGAQIHTFNQRARLDTAIVGPKILYVALHGWLTRVTLLSYVAQSNPSFKDKRDDHGYQNDNHIYHRGMGGIEYLPPIEGDLVTMSAAMSGQWALILLRTIDFWETY